MCGGPAAFGGTNDPYEGGGGGRATEGRDTTGGSLEELEEFDGILDPAPSAEELLLMEEREYYLLRKLEELSWGYRSVLVHRYGIETGTPMTPREVAVELDLPVEAVKWREKIGLAVLKKRVRGEKFRY